MDLKVIDDPGFFLPSDNKIVTIIRTGSCMRLDVVESIVLDANLRKIAQSDLKIHEAKL